MSYYDMTIKERRKKLVLDIIKVDMLCGDINYECCSKDICILYSMCKVDFKYISFPGPHDLAIKIKLQDLILEALIKNIVTEEEINSILFDKTL